MPKHSDVERRRLTEWALVERAQGRTYTDLAEEAAVDRHTIKAWIENEYAIMSEHRSVSTEREQAIATYEGIIRDAWERLKRLDDNSTNVVGLHHSIRRAQARIDKLTGAEAPIKHPEVEDEIIVEWEDSLLLCPRCHRQERLQSPEDGT